MSVVTQHRRTLHPADRIQTELTQAFDIAKGSRSSRASGKLSDDFVDRKEFRVMLVRPPRSGLLAAPLVLTLSFPHRLLARRRTSLATSTG
eukprot:6045477-Prymnesium_polylepis.1